MDITLPLILLIGYLIGSIPFGLVLTKVAGLGDIRNVGSGNIGATNVLRTGNKKLAFLTLLLDGGKGAFAIFITYYFFMQGHPCSMGPRIGCVMPCTCFEDRLLGIALEYYVALFVGFFAIIGHCYPVWLKFKGGKGVATALGTLLAAIPYIGVIACLTWLLTAIITRISSLSALVAVGLAPVFAYFLYGTIPAIISVLIAVLVYFKHKDNICRLLKGEEPKIGKKK